MEAVAQEISPLGVSVEKAATILGVSPRQVYYLMSDSEVESYNVGARKLVVIESLRRYMERHRSPLAIISESHVDDEFCRLSITSHDAARAVELRVQRVGTRALIFAAEHLVPWSRALTGQIAVDRCWRHGIGLDPLEAPAPKPLPLPATLCESFSEPDCLALVELVDHDGVPRVKITLQRDREKESICFDPRHLSTWKTDLAEAVYRAQECGLLSDIPTFL